MYLKSVEIYGFKSFANRLVLTFNNGITGVVGPNGSGKSNVADALRWVFGEQSAKQLRGSKMEDIIFSGTETKKPQSYAYVSITIDNSDKVLPIEYEEVTVSRRVYRSGESEYLLNGHNCRLKDIEELFFDTGIGKEGYSIIGQGQVEKIVNSRPEDRRELFDEAVGITKFKKKKEESIKKLVIENSNLARVTDIISEIENQLGPLKEQSEKAKKYLACKDELKKYEIANFVRKYDTIEENRIKIESDKNLACKNLSEISEKYETIKQKYTELEAVINEKSEKVDIAVKFIGEKKVECEKFEGDIRLISEKLSHIYDNNKEYEKKIDLANDKVISIKNKESKLIDKKKELISKEKSLNDELRVLNNFIDAKNKERAELEVKRDNAVNKKLNDDKERDKAGTQSEFYNKSIEENNLKRRELDRKLLKNKETIADIAGDLSSSSDKIENLTEEKNNLLKLKNDEENLSNSLLRDCSELEKNIESKQKEIYSENAIINSYRSMIERYEGYGNTVKSVMEHGFNGIIGPVADIIKVKGNYETAIETAIGGTIRNIVTDTERTAKEVITWLKEKKLGRATFLPLDAMDTHKKLNLSDNIKSAMREEGIVGAAYSLVEYDAKYEGLINFILGRILVAKDIDCAAKIAKKYRYSLKIVTLQGEQLSIGGAISGGAFKNSTNFLGRNRELESAKENVIRLETELNELNEKLEELKTSQNVTRENTVNYDNKISKLLIELNTEINLKKQLENRKVEVEKVFNEIERDIEGIDRTNDNIKSELKKLEVILADNSYKSRIDISNDIEEILNAIKELDNEISFRNEKISELKVAIGTVVAEKKFIEEDISRIIKEKTDALEEIKQLNSEKIRFKDVVNDKLKELENIKKNKDLILQEIKEKTIENEKLISEKENIKKSYDNFFTEREHLSELKANLDKEVFRLTANLEKAENEITDLLEYMLNEYNLTYSEAIKQNIQIDDLSATAIKKHINNQRELIKSLGDVNVSAIEEYKAVSYRYDLLTTQAEDIRKAENSLKVIIKELDKNMRERFSERFKDINEQFNVVFKELFGGGTGKLELNEEEDILEAGIKITAKPPGKKLQNMMQLSGGEKALTSIALIFAIQNLKPSPFCILDEIEAALDESNVERFAGYLQKLTDNTQFIVITHRRGTMKVANTLYGITMQEKGVSTMISVDFKKD